MAVGRGPNAHAHPLLLLLPSCLVSREEIAMSLLVKGPVRLVLLLAGLVALLISQQGAISQLQQTKQPAQTEH